MSILPCSVVRIYSLYRKQNTCRLPRCFLTVTDPNSLDIFEILLATKKRESTMSVCKRGTNTV